MERVIGERVAKSCGAPVGCEMDRDAAFSERASERRSRE
jgi:hypothetical protein